VEAALQTLAFIGKLPILDLIQVLQNKRNGVTLASIYALENIRFSANPALSALENMRFNANPNTLTLAQSLKDKDWNVRVKTSKTLGKMGPQALCALPALTRALKDRVWNVRKAVAEAIGSIASQTTYPIPTLMQTLMQTLHDEMVSVRREAQEAIAKVRENQIFTAEPVTSKEKAPTTGEAGESKPTH
jgi:HEAT repeat protein